MPKRKRKVPEPLWRVFHNRARTLSDTILSYLPSPPPSSPADCRCKGRRCLGCAGDKALSFLLRAKDPSEYRKLLTKCFVVVNDNAPPFPGFDPARRWQLLEIIRRSIEMIMSERSASSNILCCGFDKRSRSSDTVELLASSSWKLLLKRVGDVLMVYLLMNTSLFIPLPERKYLQVAGFPISSLCPRFSNEKSSSGYQHISQSNFGREKKGEVYDEVDRRNANKQGSSSAHVDFHSSFSGSIIGCSGRTNASPSGKHCGEKCYHKTPAEGVVADGASRKVCDSSKPHENSIQAHKTLRKRKRPTSWQRRRNHRQLNSKATNSCITHEIVVDNAGVELVKGELQGSSSACVDFHSRFSGSIIGCSEGTNASTSGKHCSKKCYHKTPSNKNAEADGVSREVFDSWKSCEKFIQAPKMSRKRKRPASLHPRQKARQLHSVATNSCITRSETLVDNANIALVKEEIQGRSSARVDFHSSLSCSLIGCSERTNASPSGEHCDEKCYHMTLSDGSAEADLASREVCDPWKSHETSMQAHKMSRKRKRPTSWQRRRKRRQLNSVPTSLCITHLETCVDNGDVELVKVDRRENTSESVKLPRKSLRQYSWQRLRNNVKLNTKVTSSLVPCSVTLTGKHTASSDLSHGLNSQQSIPFEKTQCNCCFQFQGLHKVNATAEIDRKRIFYKLRRSPYIFPRKHILNTLLPSSKGAKILFRQIFGSSDVFLSAESIPCRHHEHSLVKSTCLYHLLLKQLKSLIRNTQSCQHLRLLDKHCAIGSMDQVSSIGAGIVTKGCESEKSAGVEEFAVKRKAGDIPYGHDSETCTRIPETQSFQCEPSKYVCPKRQVVSFIWAVCRSIVPRNLLGSPSNWRILRKSISKFICLRRFEKFTLRECMHKFKVSKYPLVVNTDSLCLASNITKCGDGPISSKCKENIKSDAAYIMKHQLLECWILWLFSQIVVPLLQANFYVTESENMNQEVHYFRRSIWEKLACKGFTGLKDQSHLQLSLQSVRNIIRGRSFGFSQIRLLPKGNGFRMLANLKAPSRLPVKFSTKQSRKISSRPSDVKYEYFKPVNKFLSDVHGVLKGVKLTEPEKLGSSVFDYNDVYRKIIPFLSILKNGSAVMPGVFVVVSDVSKAFDTVDQKILLNVMDEVLSEDEYSLKKHLHVLCTRKSLLVCKHQELPQQENVPASLRAISNTTACAPSSIIVKEQSSRKIQKEDIRFSLDQHIRHNVLQLGNIFFLQAVGIPQGSVLSSLLCSFYLGHLEKTVIVPFLEKAYKDAPSLYIPDDSSDLRVEGTPNYLLLRFIDDFLFISTSKKQASSLFSQLKRGFPQYNCYMNESKFGLNFSTDQISGIGSSNRHVIGKDGILFLRWSGLLVNSSTLEIQADYSRYIHSHLSTSLTVSRHGRPGCLLKGKLRGYLRPKCHPLFYDSNINSAAIVRLNIYQAFLLCAMKFHWHVRELNGISTLGIKFCTDAVLTSISYMKRLIKRRMHSIHIGSGFRPRFEVAKEEIEWLGLTAYIRVLKRKQSSYGYLISILRSKLMTHKVGKNMTSALEYAVDDSHSFQLWQIKY